MCRRAPQLSGTPREREHPEWPGAACAFHASRLRRFKGVRPREPAGGGKAMRAGGAPEQPGSAALRPVTQARVRQAQLLRACSKPSCERSSGCNPAAHRAGFAPDFVPSVIGHARMLGGAVRSRKPRLDAARCRLRRSRSGGIGPSARATSHGKGCGAPPGPAFYSMSGVFRLPPWKAFSLAFRAGTGGA